MPSLTDGEIRRALKEVEQSGKQLSLVDGEGHGPHHRRSSCRREMCQPFFVQQANPEEFNRVANAFWRENEKG
ncbi:hypothetical protein [Flavisphingomonas formosensis]|uniref:hypothetical protein n=1 Tax=Flavisphingomonas formosensis TaxID=861534 RepID=UPI0012FB03E1|nr:hypothetical protein [Sphingomonas formosensis]